MKQRLIAVAAILLIASSGYAQNDSFGVRRIGQSNDKASKQQDQAVLKVPLGFITAVQASRVQQEEAESRGGHGPSKAGKDLAGFVNIDRLDHFDGLDVGDLCRLSTTVYPDVNEASGIYYYYPERWYLHFEPDEGGYHLRIDYKASTEFSNEVLLVAQLTPGFDRQDVEFLQAMLEEYHAVYGDKRYEPRLLALPASAEAAFDLETWDIEEVTIHAVEPDTNTIHLSISADVPTKELVTSTLIHDGLPGSVSLHPDVWGEGQTLESPIDGYAEIRVGDIAGGPALRWPRRLSGGHAELDNDWPFDMSLNYLTYLHRKSSGGLVLRGWDLGDQVLGPGDTARIPFGDLNREFLTPNSVDVRFVGRLMNDENASRAVIESCTGGVGTLPNENLMLDVMQSDALFDQYSIYKIVVQVRSAHFDPEGRGIVTKTYELDGSEGEMTADTFWLWDDPSGADLYQYRIGVVTTDGVLHADRNWRRPEDFAPFTINVGSDQVEDVLAE